MQPAPVIGIIGVKPFPTDLEEEGHVGNWGEVNSGVYDTVYPV